MKVKQKRRQLKFKTSATQTKSFENNDHISSTTNTSGSVTVFGVEQIGSNARQAHKNTKSKSQKPCEPPEPKQPQ